MTVPASVQPKWFLQSMTVWGIVISVAGSVLPGLESAGFIPQGAGSDVTNILGEIGKIVGPIITLVGRFRASQPVTLAPPVAPTK